ncbi:hypothetical protein HPULCUR_010791 [Helicostylum pulchrum]|uniref:Uncharacterized protein n=1 Tax=Helicostylum pulchrum TaxID=562976 RepID=A0ABP9YE95_9FUNG
MFVLTDTVLLGAMTIRKSALAQRREQARAVQLVASYRNEGYRDTEEDDENTVEEDEDTTKEVIRSSIEDMEANGLKATLKEKERYARTLSNTKLTIKESD